MIYCVWSAENDGLLQGLTRRADHPVHEIPSGSGSQAESAVEAGRRRPNGLQAA